MKINSYKIINLYNKMGKQQKIKKPDKDYWLTQYFRNETEVGDVVIIHYTPEFESNFDQGCVYVFRRTLFSYICLDLDNIIPITNDIHKQAERAIDKFKAKYSTDKVVKSSWS